MVVLCCCSCLPIHSNVSTLFLHQGFIHRRTKQTLKVFDMDMSRVIPRIKQYGDDPNTMLYPQLTLQVGSPRYISPEVARREPYNLKSDVYTFGLIVWEMLTLHSKPYSEFEANDNHSADNVNDGTFFSGDASLDYEILVEGKLRPTLPRANWSKEVCDFVEDCWDHDLTKRPNMQQAYDRLRDIHQQLTDSGRMIPSTNKHQVCKREEDVVVPAEEDDHDNTNEEPSSKRSPEDDTTAETTTTTTTSSTDGVDGDDGDEPITRTSHTTSRMKKSQSWCQLMSLGMVDDDSSSSDDDGHYEFFNGKKKGTPNRKGCCHKQ